MSEEMIRNLGTEDINVALAPALLSEGTKDSR